ncbi:Protein of unknown function [Streptococcus henryi]|uniref:Tail assembly protein n=1 Tax=Streptococcus henryi TaxID=439219 RepID=A0A1G6AKK4_9STRE|nr:DUF806 family protein [Streptococcus henryi]QBX25318.1 tail assembly protein [Streptococcus phage Javan252]SDB08633.1 Protein of unknown function [Streptococcus henryi]
MLATLEIRNLIAGGEFDEINEVYANNLPKEMLDNTDKTIALVMDSNQELGMTGNNDFFSKINEVEIQIFYKLDIDFELDDFETRLLKYLIKNHCKIEDIKEHTIDPDTMQLTAVFYISFEKILKGE